MKNVNEQTQSLLSSLNVPDADQALIDMALEPLPEKDDPDTFTVDEIVKDRTKFNYVKDYMEARLQNDGIQQEDESDEDYVDRFKTHWRWVTSNMTFGGYPELVWTQNASEEDKLKALNAHGLFEEMAPMYEEGGKELLRGLSTYIIAGGLDPFNYVGPGVAKLVGGTSIKAANKIVLDNAKTRLYARKKALPYDPTKLAKQEKKLVRTAKAKSYTAGAIGEGAVAPLAVTLENQLNIARGVEEELTATDFVFPTLAYMFLGGIGTGAAIRPGQTFDPSISNIFSLGFSDKSPESILDDKLAALKNNPNRVNSEIEEAIAESNDAVLKLFDPVTGDRSKLKELSPETILTMPEVKNEFAKISTNIARALIASDPSKYTLPGKKEPGYISNMVNNILINIDTVPDDVLESAMTKSGTSAKDLVTMLDSKLKEVGLTMEDFAKASKQTTTDAAANMNAFSRVARLVNKAAKQDPEVETALKVLSGDINNPLYTSKVLSALQYGERNMKVLLTTAFSTTVRNVVGTGTNLTINTMSDLFENFTYLAGSTASKIARGDILEATKELGPGLMDVIKDSFLVYYKLITPGKTNAEVEKLLEFNPRFLNQLNQAVQETGNKSLSPIVRFANGINMAQDSYFRKAIFMSSVVNQLKKVRVDAAGKIVAKGGKPLDVYDIMANNKAIPPEVFQRAADDAMKTTMAYRFKKTPGSIVDNKGVRQEAEDFFEGTTAAGVEFLERVPGLSLAIPFPNFMANAMRQQYRLSPLGAASGVEDMIGALKFRDKDPQKFEFFMRRGLNNVGKSATGMGILAYFTYHAAENPDMEAGKLMLDDGQTYDLQGVFPFNVYSQLGRFIVDSGLSPFEGKTKSIPKLTLDNNAQELVENILGIQRTGGSTHYLLEQLQIVFQNVFEEGGGDRTVDNVSMAMGKFIESITGRAIQPTKTVFDYMQSLFPDSQQGRDPNIIDPFDEKYTVKPEDVPPQPEEGFSADRLATLFKSNFNISLDVAENRLSNKVPILKEKLPLAKQYLREGAPRRFGIFEAMAAGRIEPQRNELEKLFNRLRIEPFKQFPRTNFPMYDRLVVIQALPEIEKNINRLRKIKIEQDGKLINYFDNISPDDQRLKVIQETKKAIEVAKTNLIEDIGTIDPNFKEIIGFFEFYNLPTDTRKKINRYYSRQNNGLAIETTKEFSAYKKYLPFIDNPPTTQQMDRLFPKK